MSNLTSGSNLIQVTMLRLCSVFAIIGIIFACRAAHAAQPSERLSSPELEFLTFQIAFYDTTGTTSYHFSELAMPRGSKYTVPIDSAFGSNFNLPIFAKLKINNIWITSIRWHLASNNEHASLAPVFRVESDDSRLEIRPIQHSAWMVWRKALP